MVASSAPPDGSCLDFLNNSLKPLPAQVVFSRCFIIETGEQIGAPLPTKIIVIKVMSATIITMLEVKLAFPKELYKTSLLWKGLTHVVWLNNSASLALLLQEMPQTSSSLLVTLVATTGNA